MKKTTALLLFIVFSFATYAQKSFQFGLQFSPNLSWIKPNSDNVENDGLKFGFNYGLIGDFNIADNYSISTGISIINTGGKLIFPDRQEVTATSGSTQFGYGQTTADLRLKYIEIPITLKLKTNEIGYMKYYGQFGFGLGVNYDASADEEFKYVTASNESATLSNNDVDYKKEINLLRTSLIVGLGAEYNLSGNTSIIFGVTFNNGFTNILSEDTYKADGNGNAVQPPNVDADKKDEDFKAINNFIVFNLGIIILIPIII